MRNLRILAVGLILATVSTAVGANTANPSFVPGDARLAIGVSYHLGGYSLANSATPSIFNRAHAGITLAPAKFIDFGIDLGATQVEVASSVSGTDTIDVFHGGYGFSGGGHVKLSSPFFLGNMVAIIGIGQATYFSSKNEHGAVYGGYDGAGAAGIQVRIPQTGFVTAGAKLYMIQGTNKNYSGESHPYSNVNNVRGWLAVDFVPAIKGDVKGKPYFSFETSVAPKVKFGKTVPVEEISFSFSIGWISPRLWGIPNEDEEL